jgi:hypothetical protein
MSGQPILAPGLVKALHELLAAPDTVTDDGVGTTITEAVAQLAAATTRLALAIERFCELNDGGT